MSRHLPLPSVFAGSKPHFKSRCGFHKLTGLVLLVALLSTSFRGLAQTLSASMPFPQFNSSYISGTDITIQATATTPTGTTITKVEFFFDAAFSGTYTKIGEDETAPYSVVWTAPSVPTSRSYQIRAVVTNSASATAVANAGTGYNGITVYAPSYVSTRNWYVSAAALATNTAGTEASPFNTIQKAADRVAPGDTVFVMAGTYTSTSINIAGIQRTGLPARWIVFMPYKTDKPVLQMGNNNFQAFNVLPAAAYIRIQGFEVIGNNANITLAQAQAQPGACEGPSPTATPTARFNGNGIAVIGRSGGNLRPHHVVIANNSVHDCAGGGISSIESDYVTVEDNTIYNTSWYTVYGTSGISLFNSWNYDNSTDTKMIVRRNRSYGNILKIAWNIGGTGTNCKFYDGNGIILDNNRGADPNNAASIKNALGDFTGKFLVENNICYLNGGRGININYSDNALILNNTTYQNGQSDGVFGVGIDNEFIMQGSVGSRIYNNIFYGKPGENPSSVSGSSDVLQNNNLTFSNAGNGYFTGGQNIVGQDPQFVDAPNSNFQLASTSPAINVGSSTPGHYATKDILGIDRPQGSGVDMGAYESQQIPVVPQPSTVSIAFPYFRSSFITGTPVTIRANTTTPASTTVTKVEFFLGTFTGPGGSKETIKLGEDTTAPYEYTWTIPAGQISYNELSVKVTNTTGATAVQGGTGYIRVDAYAPTTNSNKKYYVKESAAAGGNGLSPDTPFTTIQAAQELVQPGDSVFVMTGTYRNTGTNDAVVIRRTGTAAHWIVFTNYQNDKPKVSFNGYQGFNLLPGAAYIKLQGFDIEGNNANITLPQATTQPGSCDNPTGTVNPAFNGNGIAVSGRSGGNSRPHHIVIASNSVHDCAGGGISAIESDYITVENNAVYNNAWYTIFGASGISFLNSWNYDTSTDTPRMIIRNNRCYGNRLFVKWNNGGVCQGITDGNGIILDNNNDKFSANPLGAYTGQFLVENNVAYGNGGRGININYSDNVTVRNNTTYQNAASPEIKSELVMNSSKSDRIYNNIFYGRSDKLLTIVNSPVDIQFDNNLSFGGNAPSYFTDNHNITGQDPQFVDAPNNNFQLASTSPAINAGSSTPGQYATKDILGIDRPQGIGVDIGAYEFQGTPIAITQQPASASAVCVGTAVSVSVGVAGPVTTYQWYKDNAVLTGVASATTATLSLAAVTPADQGSYVVVVTGFNSLTSTAFTLTVNTLPTTGLTAEGTISCTSPSVTLTAAPVSNVLYSFSSGATQNGAGNTATVTQAGTYSVLVTSPEGCTASASVAVSGSLTTPDAPAVSSVTATQGSDNITLTVSNCSGTVNWNGTDGGTSLVVSTSAVGTFVYAVTCKVGVCVSPVTSVTVLVTASPSTLSVSYRDGDNNQTTNNTIRPYLKLNNDGTSPVSYSDITIRYWLTVEDFAPLTNLSVYWAQLGTNNVRMKYVPLTQPRQGALGYVEYSFDASAGTLAAGANSGEIQTGVGKQNWTNLSETDDYSFAPSAAYTKTDRITVYKNGVLAGGIEPAIVAPVTSLKVYAQNRNSSPTTNQISTYVKLANEGNVPVDYSQLTIRYWFSEEGNNPLVYSLDYADLGNNNIRSRFVKENRAGTDTYLELSFVPTLGQLQAVSSTGIIQQRINKSDWSNFNEANDFSYKPAGALAENTSITAYLNGVLVYGQEPGPVGARVGAESAGMRVVVLGNPIQGDAVDVNVSGVAGQLLRIELVDARGQLLTNQQVEEPGASANYRLPVGRVAPGILLLRVSTQAESQTIKLSKP